MCTRTSNPEGGNLSKVTTLGSFSAAGRWSPDGKQIAFVTDIHGQYEIYLVPATGGKATRLTNAPSHETAPNWSRDGKWVYFASNRTGTFQVWKMPPDPNGIPVQVTRTEGFAGIESMDGRYLYYCKRAPSEGVFRIPVEGGEEEQILPAISAWGNFDVARSGIYFSMPPSNRTLYYYDFATKQTKVVMTVPKPLGFGVSISNDGKTLLYTSIDQQSQELVLVENFR